MPTSAVWAWMPRAGLGGLQRLAMSLHTELLHQGVDARLLFTGGDPTRLVAEVAGSDRGVERLGRMALVRRLAAERPRVLIHHTGDTHRWLPLLRVVSPATRHVRFVHQGFGAKRDPWHRLVYAGTARCIVPTHRARERVIACLPLPVERLVRLPYGVRVPTTIAPPPPYAPPFRLAILSRIDRGKGQVEFVQALAAACRLRPELPRLLRLDIWGGFDAAHAPTVAYREALLAAAADPALAGCVQVRGHTADPGAVLAGSHYLVFPSLDEFYGLALLESYAHAVPAICARRGSFTELHDATRGLFVDFAGDIAGQLAALPDIGATTHRAWGEAARAHALATAGLDRCVSSLRAVLDGL